MHSIDDLASLRGASFGPGEWVRIDQTRIDQFSEATGDHQWIHRAGPNADAGPFGGPIAHGYLTLSLVASMWGDVLPVSAARMVNYGLNRVRFTAPVPAGARVRLTVQVLAVETIGDAAVQLSLKLLMEKEGAEKPVLIAEPIYRLFGSADNEGKS